MIPFEKLQDSLYYISPRSHIHTDLFPGSDLIFHLAIWQQFFIANEYS